MAAPSPDVGRPPFKDGLVALLPDLRAFSRFLCRERVAADDLVQNTALIALSKQSQFEPGTNLKAWLFTICLLYTSPSPRDGLLSRMPSSA